MKIRVFTDGACSENPGPGGWAAVFNSADGFEILRGHETKTTNNRMELMAVVKSFEKIYADRSAPNNNFELYSDSAYVINAINNGWINKWQQNGWKTTKLDDVKNKDLWEMFLTLKSALDDAGVSVKLIKIKGHAGNAFNEMVDKLAKEETSIAKEKIRKEE